MTYCEQCGSTSHDEQGFCRGCGTRLAGFGAASSSASSDATKPAPANETKATIGSIPLAQPQVKNVWVAVLLALFLGPIGMAYCTYLGAFVMILVTLVASFFLNYVVAYLVISVICAVWAWFAARSANSIY